jgi:hypothetical protein
MDNARFRRNRYLYYDYSTLFVLYNVLISFNCMVQLVVIMIIKKKLVVIFIMWPMSHKITPLVELIGGNLRNCTLGILCKFFSFKIVLCLIIIFAILVVFH